MQLLLGIAMYWKRFRDALWARMGHVQHGVRMGTVSCAQHSAVQTNASVRRQLSCRRVHADLAARAVALRREAAGYSEPDEQCESVQPTFQRDC